jgi:cellobiose phosphorylase
MSYGFFDDENKEYVIKTRYTFTLDKLPWHERFLWNYFQYCRWLQFLSGRKLRRLTRYRYNNIPMDSNGRYLYIKDGDSVWNPTWKPMNVEMDTTNADMDLVIQN